MHRRFCGENYELWERWCFVSKSEMVSGEIPLPLLVSGSATSSSPFPLISFIVISFDHFFFHVLLRLLAVVAALKEI